MSENYLQMDERDFNAQVLKEYGKTKEELEEYINILREWAAKQPHFPEKPPRSILKSLILYNKFSIEKAKQKLNMFYTIRGLMPELYRKHPLSPEMIEQSKITFIVPLPKLTKNFERIFYLKFNPLYSPDDFIHEKWAAHFINVLDMVMETDNCFNFHLILDTQDLQFKHLTRFSPMILKKCSMATELQTHSSGDVLLEKFGKECLPQDAGGELPSVSELNELLLKKFEEHKDRFHHLHNLKVDESLRPAKLKNDDTLGYYGNFRKIDID